MGAGGADELLTKLIDKGERWDPVEEQSALADVQAELFASTFKPITLSRYVLLSPLGAGGGGIVYGAYDPHLHRKVAVKVLRTGEGSTALASRERLLREAQAIAQLSHPNVVAVYDVGTLADGVAPSMGDGVFMVMELIEGETVRDWLNRRSRERSEVLEVFLAAGRGLAAAHARGIIHRDFKPSNVLVGDDGRARVLDFGLARAIDTPHEQRTESSENSGKILDVDLTDAGTVMGTPRYMAPEQHAGAAADARTDQFGFCATLYEALAGAPAFGGKNVDELLNAKEAGPPMLSNAPRWLAEAVARGLQPKADDRYPDMNALLAALGRDPARRTKRLLSVAAVIGLGAAIVASGYLASDKPTSCEDPSARLAGIWDAETKAQAKRAFEATNLAYAGDTWTAVESSLDDYAQRWRTAHLQTCEATLVEGAQSPELMGLQMLCLDRQLESVRQLSRLLASADEPVVRNAVSASSALPAPERCQDAADKLEGRLDLGGQERDEVLALDGKLLRATVLADAGKYEQSRQLIAEVLEQTGGFEAHRTEARARLLTCEVDWMSNLFADAERSCEAALVASERGSSAALAFDTMILLARVRMSVKAHGEAERILEIAKARLESIPAEHRDELAEARISLTMGLLRDGQWREAEAFEHLDHALALHESALGDAHPALVSVLNGLGMVAGAQGRESAARGYYQRALQISENNYGSAHPHVGSLLNNLGGVEQRMGELDTALTALSRSLEIKEAQLGPDSPRLVTTLDRLGRILTDLGRPDEALVHHQRAIALQESATGAESHLLVEPLVEYGHSLRVMGRCDEAMATLERAAKLLEAEPDAMLSAAAEIPFEQGKCLVGAGEDEKARVHFEASLAVESRQRGEDSRYLAEPLLEIALIRERAGDVPGARLGLRRAAEICAATEGTPDLTSRVESALTRVENLDG